MNFLEEKLKIYSYKLRDTRVRSCVKLDKAEYVRCGYKKNNTPPSRDSFLPYDGEFLHFDKDAHAWFRLEFDVEPCGKMQEWYFAMSNSKEAGWDVSNPQCIVYVDGMSACHAFDKNHTEMPIAVGHRTVYIYFYAGFNETDLPFSFTLCKKSMVVNKLYYDMLVPYEALTLLDKNSYEYNAILNTLVYACNLIDFRDVLSDEYVSSAEKADDYLVKEFYAKLCGKDTFSEIALIGHTHIDVAWLWTLAQTSEKAQRTFSTMINLLDRYGDFLFMSSQPQLYEYVKDNDAVLYEKIKKKIADGRWEAEGGMWLEADTNLTGGESLIRQFVYGKRFMREEFGVENHILWLPDVFGYSAALPQIMKKCGIDTFFTAKLSWNETDSQPHDSFVWQGIDGSEVFAQIIHTYVNKLDTKCVFDYAKLHKDKRYTNIAPVTFGFGDGGGGPTEEMLEKYERLKFGIPGLPKVTLKHPSVILDEVKSQFYDTCKMQSFTPKWAGELYLEMHRGTYTSMAKNKKNNRNGELLLQKCETASCIAKMLCNAEYPTQKMSESWKIMLRNQFHDILPGSSIKEVYDDCDIEYAAVFGNGKDIFTNALSTVAEQINTDGGILVYNPTSFTVSEVVEFDGQMIYAADVPSHGYRVVNAEYLPSDIPTATENTLENNYLRVVFDEKYHIVSLYDKIAERETIAKGESANVLEVFEDLPKSYDAWEISEYYKQKRWIADDVSDVKVDNSRLCASITVKRSYCKSEITQKIMLTAESRRLDFVTTVDWHETHVLMKAAFPFDVKSNLASYDIQFGHITRPTHKNTSWDEAKFEVCAHKWADISDADYGVSLLNDCKYGYSAEENVLKLTLLKSAIYPNPQADRGINEFTYSVYPHSGTLSKGGTVKQAYMLNNPLCAVRIGENKSGKIPDEFSFVKINSDSAVVETVKCADDTNGYIVRLYDSGNVRRNVTLTFGFDVKMAFECDMLENVSSALDVKGNSVGFGLDNFEVKTIRVVPV